jgi:hypothetical protein
MPQASRTTIVAFHQAMDVIRHPQHGHVRKRSRNTVSQQWPGYAFDDTFTRRHWIRHDVDDVFGGQRGRHIYDVVGLDLQYVEDTSTIFSIRIVRIRHVPNMAFAARLPLTMPRNKY